MMRGMTQEQFAAELGIPKYSIRAYEQRRRFPKYETLDSICETLDTSPEYLLCLGIMNANEFVHMLLKQISSLPGYGWSNSVWYG